MTKLHYKKKKNQNKTKPVKMVLFSYFWLYFFGSTGPKMMRFKCKLYITRLF